MSKSWSTVSARLLWHLQAVIVAAGGEYARNLCSIRRHYCPSRFGLRRGLLLRLPEHLRPACTSANISSARTSREPTFSTRRTADAPFQERHRSHNGPRKTPDTPLVALQTWARRFDDCGRHFRCSHGLVGCMCRASLKPAQTPPATPTSIPARNPPPAVAAAAPPPRARPSAAAALPPPPAVPSPVGPHKVPCLPSVLQQIQPPLRWLPKMRRVHACVAL